MAGMERNVEEYARRMRVTDSDVKRSLYGVIFPGLHYI
jgi:hypothetical protein